MVILICISACILACLSYLFINLKEYLIFKTKTKSSGVHPKPLVDYSEDVYFLYDFKDRTQTFNYNFISESYYYDLSNRSTELNHIQSNLKLNKNLFIESLLKSKKELGYQPSKYLAVENLLMPSNIIILKEFNESLNYLLTKSSSSASKEYLEDLCYNYFYNLLKNIYKHNLEYVDLPVKYKAESLRLFSKVENKFMKRCSEILKEPQKLILEDLHLNADSRFESITSENNFKTINQSIDYILNQKDDFNNLELKVVVSNLKDSTIPALKLYSLDPKMTCEDRILLDSNLDIIKNIVSTDHTTSSIKNDLLITERYLKSLTVK